MTTAFWAVLFSSAFPADYSLSQLEASLNDLIYRLSRSVVTVESRYSIPTELSRGSQDEAVFNFFTTGIIYDSLGHVLTMASSIDDHLQVFVRFEDLTVPARVVAVDHLNGLVMLETDAPLGEPADLSIYHGCAGKMVLTLGNAYGLRAAPSIGFCAGVRPDGLVQFTAPITSGALGGGLFDLEGQLLGIISGGLGQAGQAEAGLAIPAHEVRQAADYLLTRGDRPAGFVGLTTTEIEIVPPLEIAYHGYLAQAETPLIEIDRGVVVTRVVPASPAAQAGLKEGDLVFSIDHESIPSAAELADLVRRAEPGTVFELGVIRQNQPYNIPVKVGHVQRSPRQPGLGLAAGKPAADNARDSLMVEITTLKRTIIYLESRLKKLR
ncbi:MAG: serine protease [Candidatus Zixiibacteriota bacterium]|nr:MAG: serine protease [candidate division Zixibacteria bacterium]